MSRMFELDEDLVAKLEARAEQENRTVDEVLEATIRGALEPPAHISTPFYLKDRVLDDDDFRVHARSMGKPRINLDCTAAALAELDRLEEQED